MLDPHMVHALHVQALRHAQLSAREEPHTVFQVSTIEALMHGAYDGDVTVAELAARADMGLGTFNGLDGELVLLDGVVHRAAADGSAAPAEPTRRVPFAVVTRFQPDVEVEVETPEAEASLLERLIPPSPICTSIRISGRFEHVHLRSVPAQRVPYPPLSEVLARQRTFDERDVRGTIIGFCFPQHNGQLDLPGRHLHFISDDRARGGHVLSCRMAEGTIALDHEADVNVELPPGVELPVDGSDGSEELARLERD